MAENIRYTLAKPARLIFASIVTPSAPRLADGNVAEPRRSATFGLEDEDFKAIVKLMVSGITAELGTFTKPDDYYLACQSNTTAMRRVMEKAEFDCRGKPADEQFKIKEKAEKRAELYRPYAGILTASSKFEISLAKLEGGVIKDIGAEAHALAQAEKECFYPGAYVVPALAFKAMRAKKLGDKDGVTAYLQNVLFIRKGERIGGAAAANSSVFGSYANYSDIDPTAMAPDGAAAEEEAAF